MLKCRNIVDVLFTNESNHTQYYYYYPKTNHSWSSIFLSIKRIDMKSSKVTYKRKSLSRNKIIDNFIFNQLYCNAIRFNNFNIKLFNSLEELLKYLINNSTYSLQSNLCCVLTRKGFNRLKTLIHIDMYSDIIIAKESLPDDTLLIINVPNGNKAGVLTINKEEKGFNFNIYAPDTVYAIKF